MAAEVYEDSLELEIGILEAVLPDSGQYLSSAYPYPSLRPTGRVEKRQFRTIVLENPYLRATILPDLGGRILRLFDKRTNIEIFPHEPLLPVERGLRGVELPHGIQIRYTTTDRLNSMGTVNYQLVPATDEEDDAGVWIGEVGQGLSFNAYFAILANAAEIRLELRLFNRVVGDTSYNGGLSFHLSNSQAHYTKTRDDIFATGYLVHSDARSLAIWSEDYTDPGVWKDGDRLNVQRFGRSTKFALGARQLDTWKFTICPYSGLSWPMIACKETAVAFVPEGISIQASKPLSCRIRLVDQAEQSNEAQIDLVPESRRDISFPGAEMLSAIYISNGEGNSLLQQRRGIRTPELLTVDTTERDGIAEADTRARQELRKKIDSHEPIPELLSSFRYEASLRRALNLAFGASSHVQADQLLEQALLYNGEDHLAWWARALFKRVAGQSVEEESAELLNAHFLAPLEPALRAESFFRQPVAQGKEANPLLKPLREQPESYVEVACLLLELNLTSEASRFIDEAIRHEDTAMLRYLQAYSLIKDTRMEVEAATHVEAAKSKAHGGPFPWRSIELRALKALQQKFNSDDRLKQYLEVAERFETQ